MWSLRRPGPDAIRRELERQAREPFSYLDVGASRGRPAPSASRLSAPYRVDHHRIRLGSGAEVFADGVAALRRWEMFRLGWIEICWPSAAIVAGTTVGVLARVLGAWSLHACRIVYVLEEPGPIERFGFAYGTLSDHAASGEERFTVEWEHEDDSVWYDLLAFSRPAKLPSRAARPYFRRLQKRFARESLRAMQRATQAESPGRMQNVAR